MKKFIGKMLYFILDGAMKFMEFLGRHHIISEKAVWNFGSVMVDKMEYAVCGLMGVTEYRNFTIKFDE